MKNEKQTIEQVKKAKGNLVSLTVKDVTKIQGGLLAEKHAKRRERYKKGD